MRRGFLYIIIGTPLVFIVLVGAAYFFIGIPMRCEVYRGNSDEAPLGLPCYMIYQSGFWTVDHADYTSRTVARDGRTKLEGDIIDRFFNFFIGIKDGYLVKQDGIFIVVRNSVQKDILQPSENFGNLVKNRFSDFLLKTRIVSAVPPADIRRTYRVEGSITKIEGRFWDKTYKLQVTRINYQASSTNVTLIYKPQGNGFVTKLSVGHWYWFNGHFDESFRTFTSEGGDIIH